MSDRNVRKCATCPNITSSIEDHHVVPLCYGGKKNGLTVSICGNCHTTVHQCIENPTFQPPPSLQRIVVVGRRAKELYEKGLLEARDKRPSLLIPLSKEDEQLLIHLSKRFNVKSRSQTMLAALRFAATYAGRVR